LDDQDELEYGTRHYRNQYGTRRHRNLYETDEDREFQTRRHHRGQYEDEEYGHDEYDTEFETERPTGDYRRRHHYFEDDVQDQYRPKSRLLQEVQDANIKLTSRLYQQAKDERDDKNTVVSPLSIQLALAALNHGARGNTRRQIGKVIGGQLQRHERKQIFRTLIRHLKGLRRSDYSTRQHHTTQINHVTAIFVSHTTPAQQQFIQRVKNNLGANVKNFPFTHQAQQCRRQINQYVAQKTHQKIKQIVPQDAITDNTKMILVNALHLKANWGRQMRNHVTKEAKFYPLDSQKVKIVEVLETQGRFKYHEDELVKVVGIPTQDRELTVYAIVPKDKDGLTEVEKLHLQDSVELKKLLEQTDMHHRRVEVQLPKFQIKHKIDVRRTLRKQGVTDAFDPEHADFSGITGVNRFENEDEENQHHQYTRRHRNPFLDVESDFETGYGQQGRHETKLHLNKFIHQSTIKITEQGITATTGSQTEQYEETEHHNRYGRRGGYENDEFESYDEVNGFYRRNRDTHDRHVVKANRAFAFVVKHNPTQQLILVGRVIDAAQHKINRVHHTINNVDQL
jgi:serpin B